MKKYLSKIITLLFLLLFLIYFLFNIEDFEIILNLNPLYTLAIGLLQLSVIFVNALFFIIILKHFKVKINFKESVLVSILTSIGNYFTPFHGGAGVRAVYLKKNYKLTYTSFLSTLTGNYIIIFFVNSLIALVGLIILQSQGLNPSIVLFLFFSILVLILFTIILFPISEKLIPSSKAQVLNSYLKKIKVIINGWDKLASNKKSIIKLTGVTLLNSALGIILYYLEFRALGITTDIARMTVFSGISSMTLLISITPGSIGIRESVLLLFQNTLSLETNEILSVSIIDRGVYFFVILISLLITRLFKIKKVNES